MHRKRARQRGTHADAGSEGQLWRAGHALRSERARRSTHSGTNAGCGARRAWHSRHGALCALADARRTARTTAMRLLGVSCCACDGRRSLTSMSVDPQYWQRCMATRALWNSITGQMRVCPLLYAHSRRWCATHTSRLVGEPRVGRTACRVRCVLRGSSGRRLRGKRCPQLGWDIYTCARALAAATSRRRRRGTRVTASARQRRRRAIGSGKQSARRL